MKRLARLLLLVAVAAQGPQALAQIDVLRAANTPDDVVSQGAGTASSGIMEAVADELHEHALQHAPTRSGIEETTVPAGVDYIRTAGYSAAGDGGHGLYKRVGSDPSHDGDFQSANGVWWELVESRPRPSQFGAEVDGSTNDAIALADAIAYAQATGSMVVQLDVGITALSEPVAIPAQVAIEGICGSRQSGSARRASTLRWTGSAGPMFTSAATYNAFRCFGVENTGTGTMWLRADQGAQNHIYQDLTFVVPTGASQFSSHIIGGVGNVLGYSVFRDIVAKAPAPVFLEIDGNGTGNGVTPIIFEGKGIWHSEAAGPFTVIRIGDETLDGLIFRGQTVNQLAAGEVTLVDTDSPATAGAIRSLVIDGNEFDDVGRGAATDLFLKLEGVANLVFTGNHIQGGGVRNYFASLHRSHVAAFHGNYAERIVEYVFHPDADSTVSVGANELEWSSVKGIYSPSLNTAGIVFPTWGASTQLRGDMLRGQDHGVFVVDVTDANAFQIALDLTKPGWMKPGQVFTVMVRNVTAGAISNPSFSAMLKTAGAFTSPGPGANRSITFTLYSDKAAYEIGRMTSDVTN